MWQVAIARQSLPQHNSFANRGFAERSYDPQLSHSSNIITSFL
jgi:hypothetical protein